MERKTFTPPTWGNYFTARQAKTEKLEKIVLTLLQQCKGEGMTVADVVAICEIATAKAKATTLRDGLAL